MTWESSSDVVGFLAAAGDFLEEGPVDNTVLLTEAAYLRAHPSAAVDQHFGWWRDGAGVVAGAFLMAPNHPPVLSLLPAGAISGLPTALPEVAAVGTDGRQVRAVVAAYSDAGIALTARSRITLCRLEGRPGPRPAAGNPRVATATDRDLLVTWFGALMAAHPGDPSELAYVVDDPLSFGGITLWEVDGVPVAMAGRSRVVAGMTRLGAVYDAYPGNGYGEAALLAAAVAARAVARDIVVFLGADDGEGVEAHRTWGFTPVLDRVMLARTGA
jgi:hypothetical protein